MSFDREDFKVRLSSRRRTLWSTVGSLFRVLLLCAFFSGIAGVVYLGMEGLQTILILAEGTANEQFSKLDMARMDRLTVKVVGGNGGSGTGFFVKPGPNGKSRILTNGHICDMLSLWPATDVETEGLTEEESLNRPIFGWVVRSNGKTTRAKRILKHTALPDLCLVELTSKADLDYAHISGTPPSRFERYAAAGYPQGIGFLVTVGEYLGNIDSSPGRVWRPRIKKRISEIKAELETRNIMRKLPVLKEELESDIALGRKRTDSDLLRELYALVGRRSFPSGWYNMNIIFGNSGSGVWNAQGEIVGVIWGVTTPFYKHALAVTHEQIIEFMYPFLFMK